jgi:heterotetrameric sarcosine oxidase gamma subunit
MLISTRKGHACVASIEATPLSPPTGTPGARSPIAPSPIARSPIAQRSPIRSHQSWEVSGARSQGPLRLADLTPLSKVLVRAAPGSPAGRRLDCLFGRTRREPDGSLVIGAGPGEWLVIGPAGTRPTVTADVEAGEAGTDGGLLTVIDVTHASVVVRLTGARSRRVLEKICAIDLSERVTPDRSSFRSWVAALSCTVARDDLGGERSYLIESDRSSGQYLFDAILDAGAEFAIEVDGYPDKEI